MNNEPASPRAVALIEREFNRDQIEQRLTAMHKGPGVSQRITTLVSGLLTAAVGAWLVAGLATAPVVSGPPPRMGIFAGLMMLVTGAALATLGGTQLAAGRREKRLLRALRDLLAQDPDPRDPGEG
jgi:hypothetical protein